MSESRRGGDSVTGDPTKMTYDNATNSRISALLRQAGQQDTRKGKYVGTCGSGPDACIASPPPGV